MLGYFFGDILGLEGASVLRLDQPCRRRVIEGDDFNRRLRLRCRRQENGACPTDELSTLRVQKLARRSCALRGRRAMPADF